jgi:hypothetical protein
VDLRLQDHPALAAAIATGLPVVPVFVWPPESEAADYAPGAASRWWLHQSLSRLDYFPIRLGDRYRDRLCMDIQTQKSYLFLHDRFLSACGSELCFFESRPNPRPAHWNRSLYED